MSSSLAPVQLRVLVVDDDAAMRALLAEALGEEGYEVRQARDGHDALCALGQQGGGAEVVIMDQCMPGTTGLQALAALRARDSRTPVVLVSAFADATLRDEARQLGAVRVLRREVRCPSRLASAQGREAMDRGEQPLELEGLGMTATAPASWR
jgi:CheY-like chemotaxis protein